jgi:hypothetical protein
MTEEVFFFSLSLRVVAAELHLEIRELTQVIPAKAGIQAFS